MFVSDKKWLGKEPARCKELHPLSCRQVRSATKLTGSIPPADTLCAHLFSNPKNTPLSASLLTCCCYHQHALALQRLDG